jgi:hypothetical protein
LFSFIRYPINYPQYTGREDGVFVGPLDAGGTAVIDIYAALSDDNFIAVAVDNSLNDCGPYCIPRLITFEIFYYQIDVYQKKIISAGMSFTG